MKRGGPIKRRTPLRARGPMRRSPSRGRPPSNRSKIPAKVRAAVERRANGWCEIAANANCAGRAKHCHHVLPRSAGGPHTEENLRLTCEPCHRFVHANPKISYERGWLQRRAA